MIVDAHTHVFTAPTDRFPRDVHDLYPAELSVPVEELITEMDANGVSHAVLVALSAHDEYIRDCLARHPGRFAGIGIQPPDAFSVDDYVSRREKSNLSGMRLFALGDPEIVAVQELPAFPLLQQMADDGAKLWFYASEPQMRLLARVLSRLPALVVVLNHLGFCPGELWIDDQSRPRFTTKLPPPTFPTTLQLAEYPNVHVLFSGHYAFSDRGFPYQDLTSVVAGLLDAFGPRRLLFGSDFPWVRTVPGYSAVLSLVDLQMPGLSPDERRDVLGGNAQRLFGFVAPAGTEATPGPG